MLFRSLGLEIGPEFEELGGPFGQGDDVTGAESVGHAVAGDSFAAFRGGGAGGELRVSAIRFQFLFRYHDAKFPFGSILCGEGRETGGRTEGFVQGIGVRCEK